MEILALLFALSPIIATLIFWVYKTSACSAHKNAETTPHIFPETQAVQVAPVAVAAVSAGASGDDEIAVVLAAAATIYVKSTT